MTRYISKFAASICHIARISQDKGGKGCAGGGEGQAHDHGTGQQAGGGLEGQP